MQCVGDLLIYMFFRKKKKQKNKKFSDNKLTFKNLDACLTYIIRMNFLLLVDYIRKTKNKEANMLGSKR